jgi:hypothetical protein
VDRYVDQELRSYPVAAGEHVYQGSFIGLNPQGYARPLMAGDPCVGLAYEEVDNSSGSSGYLAIRVFTIGDFGHALAGATLADIGRPVYAGSDDELTLDPGGGSFVGHVQDCVAADDIILRLNPAGATRITPIVHHVTDFTLAPAETGSVHTNLGATSAVRATLPTSPPKGTEFKFVCMADQPLQLAPGSASCIYVKGAKQADNKYVGISDIGDFVHLIADGNGDWVAAASIGGTEADISVES